MASQRPKGFMRVSLISILDETRLHGSTRNTRLVVVGHGRRGTSE